MSSPGMNMQNEAASALSAQRPPGQQPPPGAQPMQQQGGGLAALAQAFARCEQTKQCTPQDRQILEQGLPQLVQMAKMIQQILQASQPQQQAQPGNNAPPQPQPGA